MSLGNKETMARNIKRYMELYNKDRKEICKDLGISYSTFSDWVNANSYPRIDKIEMLANYFGIEKSDLVEKKEFEYKNEDLVEYKVNKTKFIPIVGTVRAGEPILATENIESYFAMDNTVLDKNKDYFLLKVKGDSMDREFKEGSLLLIEKTNCIESGDIGVIIVNGDEATVKKIVIDNNYITLIPLSNNGTYLPKIIDTNKKEVIIVGKVKMAIRQY